MNKRRMTVPCPCCGNTALLRVFPFGVTMASCPSCGCRSIGVIKKAKKEEEIPEGAVKVDIYD